MWRGGAPWASTPRGLIPDGRHGCCGQVTSYNPSLTSTLLFVCLFVCLYTNCEVPSLGRLPASHAGVMPDTGQVSTTTTSYLIIISDDNKLKSL